MEKEKKRKEKEGALKKILNILNQCKFALNPKKIASLQSIAVAKKYRKKKVECENYGFA
jgi:hypothetical protein